MSKKNKKHHVTPPAPVVAESTSGITTEVVKEADLPKMTKVSKYGEALTTALALKSGEGLKVKGNKSVGNTLYQLLKKREIKGLRVERREEEVYLVKE